MANVNLYRFFMRRTDGTPLAWIPPDSWLYFEYTLRVNDVSRFEGITSMTINPQLREFLDPENGAYLDAIIEVWRRPRQVSGKITSSEDFVLEGEFLLRYVREELLNDGRSRLTIIARSPVHLLARGVIMPGISGVLDLPPQGEQVSDFGWPWALPISNDVFDGRPIIPAPPQSTSEMMWAMVTWIKNVCNSTALGEVDPGALAPAVAGLRSHPVEERYKNLLDALQRASAMSWFAWYHGLPTAPPLTTEGVDFDVVRSATLGPGFWDFITYPGGRGTDRTIGSTVTTPVILTPKLNNVVQPVEVLDRLDEKTRIIVAGDGQDASREVIRVQNITDDAGSIWNRNDEYIDSRRIDPFAAGIPTAVLDAYWRLRDKGKRRDHSIIFRQTDQVRYGVDFFLGDLMTIRKFSGDTVDMQMRQIEVRVSSTTNETIEVEFGLLDGSFRKRREFIDQMVDMQGDMLRRLYELGAGT